MDIQCRLESGVVREKVRSQGTISRRQRPRQRFIPNALQALRFPDNPRTRSLFSYLPPSVFQTQEIGWSPRELRALFPFRVLLVHTLFLTHKFSLCLF